MLIVLQCRDRDVEISLPYVAHELARGTNPVHLRVVVAAQPCPVREDWHSTRAGQTPSSGQRRDNDGVWLQSCGLGTGCLRVVDLVDSSRRVGEALDLSDPVCSRARLVGAADAWRVGLRYWLVDMTSISEAQMPVGHQRTCETLALTAACLHELAETLDALASCEMRVRVRPSSVGECRSNYVRRGC